MQQASAASISWSHYSEWRILRPERQTAFDVEQQLSLLHQGRFVRLEYIRNCVSTEMSHKAVWRRCWDGSGLCWCHWIGGMMKVSEKNFRYKPEPLEEPASTAINNRLYIWLTILVMWTSIAVPDVNPNAASNSAPFCTNIIISLSQCKSWYDVNIWSQTCLLISSSPVEPSFYRLFAKAEFPDGSSWWSKCKHTLFTVTGLKFPQHCSTFHTSEFCPNHL